MTKTLEPLQIILQKFVSILTMSIYETLSSEKRNLPNSEKVPFERDMVPLSTRSPYTKYMSGRGIPSFSHKYWYRIWTNASKDIVLQR